MIDIINIAFALFSIALGAVSLISPKYAMSTLDLSDGGSTMGMSEVRAASGALFIGMGVGAMILATPAAYAMIGFCWGGAAIGRLTSLMLDGKTQKKWIFFACEAGLAAVSLAINL
ncbi:DUF4345 family protein [Yoonia sp. 208BN28-4]|uniref:DUF4345 family protein n=1 Tax=Yoonia sp. 208BN28-4 TaxID=3126505 RepID=UPI0030A9FC64